MLISDVERVERKLRIARANFNTFPPPAKNKGAIEKWIFDRAYLKSEIKKLESELEELRSLQLMVAHMPEAMC